MSRNSWQIVGVLAQIDGYLSSEEKDDDTISTTSSNSGSGLTLLSKSTSEEAAAVLLQNKLHLLYSIEALANDEGYGTALRQRRTRR